MQITPRTLKTTPFTIGPIGIRMAPNPPPSPALPHFARDPTDRVNPTLTKQPNGIYAVTFTANPAGSTIFLPYRPDEIHSIRLPANPGVGGATTFLTANLDGCCMFVDVATGGDVIVYHANASVGVTPTVQQSATMPTFQTAACLLQLNTLYQNAAPYYGGPLLPIAHHIAFRKARYLREVDAILQRKTAGGRTGVQFGAGVEHASLTTFAGFFVNNRWEFWFQTFSQLLYDRPQDHWKSKLGFQRINPHVTQDSYKVVESGRWFRVP